MLLFNSPFARPLVAVICYFLYSFLPVHAQNRVTNSIKNVGSVITKDTGCIVENDLKGMTLKGKVKSIKSSVYEALDQFGEIMEGKKKDDGDNSLYLFDEDGYLIKFENYDTLCTVEYRTSYERYPKGCITGYKEWYRDTLINTYEKKYDFKNYTIVTKNYNSINQLISLEKSKFNKNGQTIESLTYDEKGKKINRSTTYRQDDHSVLYFNYDYDGDGNVNTTSNVIYDYPAKTLTSSFVIYTKEEKEDSAKTLGSLEKRNEYEDPIKYRLSDSSSLTAYTYEYDKYSNWVKRIEYKDGELIKITKRDVEYY